MHGEVSTTVDGSQCRMRRPARPPAPSPDANANADADADANAHTFTDRG
jgi:hypothetical protein